MTPKRPTDIVAKCNSLATSILEKKYYGPNDTCPSDVFWRVALVMSIPDVIDFAVTLNGTEGLGDGPPIVGSELFVDFLDYYERAKKSMELGSHFLLNMTLEKAESVWYNHAVKYYKSMCNLDFMPGSPTLINAGGPVGMLSSCFFLRVSDSMEGIFEKVKEVALISKAGGGVGLDFSELRPQGSPVGSTNGVSSGPISFMKVFNTTGDQVQQGGVRRAALMATLRVDHPDIMSFLTCKEKEGELANFNISVLVTDAFMEAVEKDEEIELWHPASPEKKKIRARTIWEQLVKNAHRNGEPGVIFIDKIMVDDVFHKKFGNLGVNPCSELTLLPYESCNLASLNLSNCIVNGKMDYDKLEKLTKLCVNFLDNTIDLNKYVLPEIEEATLKTRRIGVGFAGLHDALLKLKVAYGSDESLEMIDQWFSKVMEYAQEESERLGKIRGVPPILREAGESKWWKNARRNVALLSCQPTGTVSILMDTSSGIEPIFDWSYERNDSYGTHEIRHPLLEESGSVENLPDYAKTSTEIPWKDHVKVQGAIQKYIDNSISKTIILPNDSTVEDVGGAYFEAFRRGCKSTTVYRDGSREEEVLSKKKVTVPIPEKDSLPTEKKIDLDDRSRPDVTFGCTFRTQTPSGEAYISVNEDLEGIREVFITVAKAGSEVAVYNAVLGRLISTLLKYRVPLPVVIEHLIGQKSSPIFYNGKIIKSVPDAVAQVLLQFAQKYEGFSQYIDTDELESLPSRSVTVTGLSGNICSECGEVMYHDGGCEICRNCGHSKCG